MVPFYDKFFRLVPKGYPPWTIFCHSPSARTKRSFKDSFEFFEILICHGFLSLFIGQVVKRFVKLSQQRAQVSLVTFKESAVLAFPIFSVFYASKSFYIVLFFRFRWTWETLTKNVLEHQRMIFDGLCIVATTVKCFLIV